MGGVVVNAQAPVFARELEVQEAAAMAHRLEVSLLMSRVERLTALLREHGIPLPGEDGRLGASDGEHLEACRRVVMSAYELVGALGVLEQMIGSGRELLEVEPWK